MRRDALIFAIALVVAASLGCGKSSTPTVSGTARVLHGPSPAAPVAARALASASPSAAVASGHWLLSPDQGKINVTGLEFVKADGSREHLDIQNCLVAFSRDGAAMSSILDCPFEVPEGTYVDLAIQVDATTQVLIDDAVNGIFTDPASATGLSATRPAGGPGLVPFTPQTPGGAKSFTVQTGLSAPLVASKGSPVSLTIVADMIHTVFANASGGTLTFDTSLPAPGVALIAMTTPVSGGAGRVEYYSPSGTAGNHDTGLGSGNEAGSVRVFYDDAGVPRFVFNPTIGPSEAWAVDPAKTPQNGSHFRPGGYLGLDASGTLCWALPTDFDYTAYAHLCAMPVVQALGSTTTLHCQSTATAPPPQSGDTYASGCPAVTPDSTFALTLVAR
ncbi:MAG TPA: hypothetical protein VN953_04615 [Gemmatimonadales bacterium]|nr:hypothetical protein [Gemmatimonadales bacterium]